MKHCPRCDRDLHADWFDRCTTIADGLQAWCKSCQNEYRKTPARRARAKELRKPKTTRQLKHSNKLQKERRTKNPEKARAATNGWYATNKITYAPKRNARRRVLLEEKAGRPIPAQCDVCGGPPVGRGTFHFDHDHVTGEFRGWLCHHCNLALGNVKDSIGRLQQLIAYLQTTTEAT